MIYVTLLFTHLLAYLIGALIKKKMLIDDLLWAYEASCHRRTAEEMEVVDEFIALLNDAQSRA